MKRYSRGVGALVLSVVILATTACEGPPPKPAMFNDRIAKNNKRLYTAARAFRKKMEPLKDATPVSPADGQRAWDDLNAELQVCIRESKHMPVTYGSASGPAYLQAYQAYLDEQETIMQNQMKRVVATLDDKQVKPLPIQKWLVIERIFAEVEKKEAAKFQALQNAQKSFCDEHHLSPSKQP